MIRQHSKIEYEQLLNIQQSTYSELAERVLPQLIEYAERSTKPLLADCAALFKTWDMTCLPTRKGAVLFIAWAFRAQREGMFEDIWKESDPLLTPGILSEKALNVLEIISSQIIERYGKLDVEFGEVYRIVHGGKDVPSGIGLNEIGSFSSGFYERQKNQRFHLQGGLAFSCIVEFGPRIKAHAVLGYGNASQKGSDHITDQLELISLQRLREVYFYEDDVSFNTVKSTPIGMN